MNFQTTQENSFALCRKLADKYLYPFLLLLSFLFIFSTQVFAKDARSINDILKQKKEPSGVVIEIVTGDESNLEWALPQAQEYITQLRDAFPKLPIAIVTHGAEQFALTKDSQSENQKVHSLVQSLGEADVPVHVCETYAGWQGITAEDFPRYVNVSAAGPAQVNDYIAIGYDLIIITDEDD